MNANTYAIPPQSRGMADVLNEAADSEDRNIESSRRQALTMQQIKSDQQRNQLASEAGARDQTRFGYETEKLDREKAAFDRAERIRKKTEASYQVNMFEEVPNPAFNARAIPTTVTGPGGDVTTDPNAGIPRTIRQHIATTDNTKMLRGMTKTLGDVFAARAMEGEFDGKQVKEMMDLRSHLESSGNKDDLLKALQGDKDALISVGKKLNLGDGALSLAVEYDKATGFPSIFASAADGKGGFTKKNVDYLVAVLNKDVYDTVIGTGATAATQKSAINYQNVAGAAATKNADSSAVSADAAKRNADTAATNAGNSGRLITAKIAALDDKGAPVNTAAYRSQFFSSQLDTEGKNLMLPSGSSNQGRIKGVAQELGLTTGQSDSFAQTEWANLMGLRDQAVAREKLVVDPTGKKTYWTKQELVQLEDRALSKLTDALVKDKSEQGPLFQRASAYAKRRAEKRASAMKTDKEED